MLKKGMLLFVLASLIMFSLGCPVEPPPEPEPEPPTIFGTWSCPSITLDGMTVTSAVITFNEGATYTMVYQMFGGPQMHAGTFAPVALPADTTITLTIVTFIGTEGPSPGTQVNLRYSNLTATTVEIEMDVMNDGFDGPYTCTKEMPPDLDKIFGTWACAEMIADGMTMAAVFLTMNENASFYLVFYDDTWDELVTQTGTFVPTTAPADTQITFTVATSSGHMAPSPGSYYYLKYSSMTDNTVDLYLDPMRNGWEGPFDYIR